MPPSDADDEGGAVVDVAPPSRAICESVARFLVDVFARRALADLGLIAVEESPGDGIANGNRP